MSRLPSPEAYITRQAQLPEKPLTHPCAMQTAWTALLGQGMQLETSET